jgi:hypothetical protein
VKLCDHLIRLSELLIQNNKINRDVLLNALSEANKSITNYIDTVKLPEAREGALVLKKIFTITKQLLQKSEPLDVMANVQQASKVSLKERTPSFNVAGIQTERPQNFSLSSTMFRHSLRLTIDLLICYGFDIKTPIDFMTSLCDLAWPN